MIKRKNKVLTIIGILIIFLGASFFIYENYKKDELIKDNDDLIEVFFNDEEIVFEVANEEIENKQTNNKSYMAILEIPNINLKRGLYDVDNLYNNVKYNLEILKGSNMPNILGSNLIIAGHNGNSYVSYFKSLDKLKSGDNINIYYQGIRYSYSFEYSYEIDKTGEVEIIRDTTKTTITLITCKKNSNDKQVVYIGYLIDSNKY